MARTLRSLAVVSLVMVLAAPAMSQEASCRLIRGASTPDDPTDDVQVCRQDVWFHANQAKLGNAAALGQGSFPTFNTTKPTASVSSGAGGGYVATSTFHQNGSAFDPMGSATFDGTFTGDLDNVAVTAYLFSEGRDAQGLTTLRVDSRLVVDGETVAETGGTEVKYAVAGTRVKRIDFAFVDLYSALQAAGLNGPGREHKVRFQVHGTGLATEAALFVYDTSEVPSGLIFNIEPENLGSYTVIGGAL